MKGIVFLISFSVLLSNFSKIQPYLTIHSQSLRSVQIPGVWSAICNHVGV